MVMDIHVVLEKQVDGKWLEIEPDWKVDRHYKLFTWLSACNVRDHRVKPILTKVRGLPEDYNPEEQYFCGEEATGWVGRNGKPLGYMDFNWLLSTEIIEAFDNIEDFVQDGCLLHTDYQDREPNEVFAVWYDTDLRPMRGEVVLTEAEYEMQQGAFHPDIRYYVKTKWLVPKTVTQENFKKFVDSIRELHATHGEFRLTMGFDM